MKKAPPLLSEAFIPVYPSLSTRYGVCGAMIIAQVHFMCYQKANDKAGYRWCYNSYAQWSELLPFSAMTIRRTMKDLELDGVIIAASYNRHGWDKTKWYRVCYEQLDLIKLNIPP